MITASACEPETALTTRNDQHARRERPDHRDELENARHQREQDTVGNAHDRKEDAVRRESRHREHYQRSHVVRQQQVYVGHHIVEQLAAGPAVERSSRICRRMVRPSLRKKNASIGMMTMKIRSLATPMNFRPACATSRACAFDPVRELLADSLEPPAP